MSLREQTAALQCALRMSSHDLRGSLLSIGMLNLLVAAEPDAALRTDYCHRIDELCTRAAAVLDNYLVALPDPRLDLQDTDFTGLVQETLDTQVAALSPLRRQRFEVSSRLAPVRWCVDGARMRQVVSSLIGNAFKHARRGKVEVSLSGRRFAVLDEGPGLPPRVFDPSVTGGLGLWLSRRIVEAHGGTLGCKSVAGQGSEFWVRL